MKYCIVVLAETVIIVIHSPNERICKCSGSKRNVYCSDSPSTEGRRDFTTGLEEQKLSVCEVKPTDIFCECVLQELRAK